MKSAELLAIMVATWVWAFCASFSVSACAAGKIMLANQTTFVPCNCSRELCAAVDFDPLHGKQNSTNPIMTSYPSHSRFDDHYWWIGVADADIRLREGTTTMKHNRSRQRLDRARARLARGSTPPELADAIPSLVDPDDEITAPVRQDVQSELINEMWWTGVER